MSKKFSFIDWCLNWSAIHRKLDKLDVCGQMAMGLAREEHVKEVREWRKICGLGKVGGDN